MFMEKWLEFMVPTLGSTDFYLKRVTNLSLKLVLAMRF